MSLGELASYGVSYYAMGRLSARCARRIRLQTAQNRTGFLFPRSTCFIRAAGLAGTSSGEGEGAHGRQAWVHFCLKDSGFLGSLVQLLAHLRY